MMPVVDAMEFMGCLRELRCKDRLLCWNHVLLRGLRESDMHHLRFEAHVYF